MTPDFDDEPDDDPEWEDDKPDIREAETDDPYNDGDNDFAWTDCDYDD